MCSKIPRNNLLSAPAGCLWQNTTWDVMLMRSTGRQVSLSIIFALRVIVQEACCAVLSSVCCMLYAVSGLAPPGANCDLVPQGTDICCTERRLPRQAPSGTGHSGTTAADGAHCHLRHMAPFCAAQAGACRRRSRKVPMGAVKAAHQAAAPSLAAHGGRQRRQAAAAAWTSGGCGTALVVLEAQGVVWLRWFAVIISSRQVQRIFRAQQRRPPMFDQQGSS
jgi:hypothetical protein